ncbi:hypothetical protein GCK72_013145 [Caenorhabditis remanei]|uniref:Major facilitator superfamily (MFS) profile domain-containing protein n=1 Tax=Caenorhabditis remanei TaxID=31234 RepID=A0A6A5GPT8_CAERE|nr:hypothetical protein GCK72_013145 [Caenorhabditis remanei]KAF1756691.1 hypothetical protein GCK72_013145 [Caenorhabditis remanei]
MKQRNFELLCAAMLGFGQLCIMVGYDSESFILESVIHSIHERNPEKVSQYAGYYGQAVIFAAYMTTCLFAPSILHISTSKSLLIFSAVSYTLFPLGFLFFNIYFYFFSAVLLGIGTSFYYLGMGNYLSQHSTRETIESNVSISWSVGCCCLMIGAGILAGITSFTVPTIPTVTQNSTLQETFHQHERRYSDNEIRMLSAAFSGMSALAIVTFALMPSKSVENSLESAEKKHGFVESLSKSQETRQAPKVQLTCTTVISPKLVQLLPLTILGGFNVSFWLAIFPTAMNFTKSNSSLIYIPAIYSLGAGLGEVLMGLLISALSKRIKGFGLKPTMVIGALSVCIYCGLVHISTPFEAPMRPTSQDSIWIQQGHDQLHPANDTDQSIDDIKGTEGQAAE